MKQQKYFICLLLLYGLLYTGCEFLSESPKPGPPIAVQCEYQSNPVGIDVENPRFSWMVNDQSRGAVQTAYQILVASSLDELAKNQGDIWDSGKNQSDQNHLIIYEGPELLSGRRYYWKVRTWNKDDQVSEFSEPAYWEMGMLSTDDWAAKWIGKNEEGRPPRSIMLRKEFSIDEDILNARLYITGLGNYIVRINGQKIGNDLLTPGWTDYPTKVQYQTYDITSDLKNGENAIGAVLGNMWWSSGLGWQGGIAYSDGPLRLLAQLKVVTSGGEQWILTDESWKLTYSPYVENTIYHGVVYDAQLEQPGWDEANFDDSTWEQSVLIEDEGRQLVAQQGPPIRITERREPVAIREVKPGVYVFDFGVNMVGYTRLSVEGSPGSRIIMRFAELLHEDGTVAQENLRSAIATDQYICKGEGIEEFEPYFTYHGFRYVQVEGLEKAPDESTLTALVFHSAADPTGEFSCSDEILNSIYENIFRGQRGNMHSVPTDCPQRDERLGWMGDAQIFAATSNYNMDMANFYKKWVRDIVDWPPAQKDTGWKLPEDWPQGERDGFVFTPVSTVINSFYYQNMKIMAEFARVLDKPEEALDFDMRAARVKKSMNELLFDKEKGYYTDGIETDHGAIHSNMLPLAFDIVPESYQQSVVDYIKTRGMGCSVYGAQFLMEALYKAGADEYALELMTATHDRSWYNMIKGGSTISWEAWDLKYKPNQDWNHAWGAAPANIVPRYMWGIQPKIPGYGITTIKPQLANLESTSIVVPTIRGQIRGEYKKISNRVQRFVIELPGNMVGEFDTSAFTDLIITVNGESKNPAFGSIRLEPGVNEIELRINSF
jgi:alpha-L-rhamnosidase